MKTLRHAWWRVSGVTYGRHSAVPGHQTMRRGGSSWDQTGPFKAVNR